MSKNMRDEDAFILTSRNCTSMLYMEYGGLVIYHMKLERGDFYVPSIDTERGRVKVVETF